MARGGLPSILLPKNQEVEDLMGDFEATCDDQSDPMLISGRILKLSTSDLYISAEYARLLKVCRPNQSLLLRTEIALLTAPVLWSTQTTQLVLSLLLSDKISTLRDVYYMDCRLYEDQTKSNRSIELLARCLNVPRYGNSRILFTHAFSNCGCQYDYAFSAP